MINAIVQIVLLLLVACGIGIYFTSRYWKEKLREAINKKDEEARNNAAEIRALKSDLATAETDLQQAIKNNKSNNGQVKTEKESDDGQAKIKSLEKEVKVLNGEIEAYMREIDELNEELTKKKVSYYKQIDGKKYKAATLLMADESIAGQGDGRISKADAEKIFDTISDGGAYTPTEKNTLQYLRENYNWTPEADELFRFKVRSWAAKGHQLS